MAAAPAAAPAAGAGAPVAGATAAPAQPQEGADEVLRQGSSFGPEDDRYTLGEEIGSGAAARVYVCTRANTGEQLAAKVINLQRLRLMGDFEAQMLKLSREVQILRELNHPRIVNLHFVHRTKNWIFLVMELVRGGELFDQIVRNRTLQEMEAKYIFSQLLEGVGYMHSRHVIHRDLKPENILIVASQPQPPPQTGQLHEVKIADFGLSKVINEGSSTAKTFVGTPQYWAPEVLNVQNGGSYTQAADFWSLGAVLFVMLCGRYPFDGKKMPLEEQIRTAAFSMTTAVWQKISEEAKDMVRGLLKVNPQERLSLDDCRRHPWFTGSALPAQPAPPQPSGPTVTEVSGTNVNNNGAKPLVTHPSTTSELSAHSEEPAQGSVHIEQTPSQERKAERTQDQQKVQAPPPGREVPQITVGGATGSASGPCDHETIFCLNELLKLQVSIAGSLEMACLAFRHADTELSDAIRRTFWQARDLFSHAANVVSQYAEVAQQVGQLVLADLKLAVDEKEPSLAVSLLGMVKGWVANMKKDGEEIQRQYMGLQESVHGLIRRAQHTKTDADRRLAEAVQAAEAELPAPPSPRTQQQFLTNGPVSDDRGAPPRETSPGPPGAAAASSRGPAVGSPGMASASTSPCVFGGPIPDASKGTLNVPFSMNVWTRQLFEQLSHAQGASGEKAQDDFSVVESNTNTDNNETWKRDVLELLFMAPGVRPSQLPKFEHFNFSVEAVGRPRAESSGQPQRAEEVSPTPRTGSETRDVHMADAGAVNPGTDKPSSSSASADAAVFNISQAHIEDAIVRFVPSASEKSAAEAVTQSSASLLRALKELKRVDEILHGCSAFWANMDGTVQKLAQMKEHTETLINFAANSKALKQRFEQRLGEYTNFWVSLERVCRQYCMDHQAASKRMYEVIREVADAADVFDTAQSARMGMALAMREKQRRQFGGMQY